MNILEKVILNWKKIIENFAIWKIETKKLYIRFLFYAKQMIKYNIKDILPFEITLALFDQIYAENMRPNKYRKKN